MDHQGHAQQGTGQMGRYQAEQGGSAQGPDARGGRGPGTPPESGTCKIEFKSQEGGDSQENSHGAGEGG